MNDLPPPEELGPAIRISDEAAVGLGSNMRADVIDTVTGARYRFLMVTEFDTFVWHRKIGNELYIPTALYWDMEWDGDEDTIDQFDEDIENGQMELVMAVALMPRYDLEAEWLSDSMREYIEKGRRQADAADQSDLDRHRMNMFGTLDPL